MKLKENIKIDKYGTKFYYNKDKQLHREDGPAIEYADEYKAWYQNGEFKYLELNYNLFNLPTSQHRAGLVGLAIMIDWLNLKEDAKILEIDNYKASFKFTRIGLENLYKSLYDSIPELDKNKKSIMIPRGAFLETYYEQTEQNSLWLKLWRDVMYNILRSKGRKKYTNKTYKQDIENLIVNDYKIKITSAYIVGYSDQLTTSRLALLLEFWTFVSEFYLLNGIEYIFVIPDIINLEKYYNIYIPILQSKENEESHWLKLKPKNAVIDIYKESGIKTINSINNYIITHTHDNGNWTDVICALDIFHIKESSSYKVLKSDRINPSLNNYQNEYWEIFGKNSCLKLTSNIFRSQLKRNILSGNKWYKNFNKIINKKLINNKELKYFSKSIEEYLKYKGEYCMNEEIEKTKEIEKPKLSKDENNFSIIMYWLVKRYLSNTYYGKYKEQDYRKTYRKISIDLLNCLRNKHGNAFVTHILNTVFKDSQSLSQSQIDIIYNKLLNNTDDFKSLLFIHLSAQTPSAQTPFVQH